MGRGQNAILVMSMDLNLRARLTLAFFYACDQGSLQNLLMFWFTFSFANKYLLIAIFIQGKFWMDVWDKIGVMDVRSTLFLSVPSLCAEIFGLNQQILSSLASGWVWPMGGISRRYMKRVWAVYFLGSLLTRLPPSSWHAASSLRLLYEFW